MVALAGCSSAPPEPRRLPTGAMLDPHGIAIPLGSMPLALVFSPDSTRIVAVLSGYREQGIQVIDRASRRVTQTIVQPAAFLGAAFSPDGRTLFVSGGNQDVVYRYTWSDGAAALADSIALGPRPGRESGHAYPAGLTCSPDGRRLYVVENLADALAVVDLASGRVVQRLPTGRYPYGVTAGPDGKVYVSTWGGSWVATYKEGARGLVAGSRIMVGRHPSAMLLDPAGGRLYVTCASSDRIAVVDTRADSVIAVLTDTAPGGTGEGSTPNGLVLSADGHTLFVAEADNNAVAIFELSDHTSGRSQDPGRDTLVVRIPVEWYPTAVLSRGDSLWVLNGKGRGTAANPKHGHSNRQGPEDPRQYTLGQTSGSLSCLAVPATNERATLSKRVAVANHWDRAPARSALPPLRHVVYVIRENRTYDQVFGDLASGDGDTSLTYFGRDVTPNAHALAERFGIYDRFFVNAEVSADGHNWTTAAYAAEYVEKTVPSAYSGRGRSYDYEGENRGEVPEDDVNEPANGYLWDLAERAQVSLRNYGEFTRRNEDGRWVGTKPWLATRTDPGFPGWDTAIPDTQRAARWLEEFAGQVAGDSMPALTLLRLPNDHTVGARPGLPTPRACVAENDLALGRVIEAITRSRYWASTIVFVVEDDAQDGPDHVDSHRSPLLVISAYNRPGVVHRFANTTDVIATINQVLGLGALSQFDRFGRRIGGFAATADLTRFSALRPRVPLDELNPHGTELSALSLRLDLTQEDRADEAQFNRILWRMMKGESRPYPQRPERPLVLGAIR